MSELYEAYKKVAVDFRGELDPEYELGTTVKERLALDLVYLETFLAWRRLRSMNLELGFCFVAPDIAVLKEPSLEMQQALSYYIIQKGRVFPKQYTFLINHCKRDKEVFLFLMIASFVVPPIGLPFLRFQPGTADKIIYNESFREDLFKAYTYLKYQFKY